MLLISKIITVHNQKRCNYFELYRKKSQSKALLGYVIKDKLITLTDDNFNY